MFWKDDRKLNLWRPWQALRLVIPRPNVHFSRLQYGFTNWSSVDINMTASITNLSQSKVFMKKSAKRTQKLKHNLSLKYTLVLLFQRGSLRLSNRTYLIEPLPNATRPTDGHLLYPFGRHSSQTFHDLPTQFNYSGTYVLYVNLRTGNSSI